LDRLEEKINTKNEQFQAELEKFKEKIRTLEKEIEGVALEVINIRRG